MPMADTVRSAIRRVGSTELIVMSLPLWSNACVYDSDPEKLHAMTPQPERFTIHVPDETLDDLRRRLQQTRWADDPGNDDWRYGTSAGYLREFVDYWLEEYDWRAVEAAINRYEHYRV